MRKVLLALFVIILFFAIYQVLTPILSANPDFSSLVVRDVLVVSLLIATLALVLALVALLRASRVQKQTEDRLIAIDQALSDFANRADVAALSMADLARATHRDIVSMRQTMDGGKDVEADAEPVADFKRRSCKVVPIKIAPARTQADSDETDGSSLQRMIETSEPRLSLQPIVDVIQSKPIAFEAYASFGSAEQSLDVQRANGLSIETQRRLAGILLKKAAEVARQIATDDAKTSQPIHVPLSAAFVDAPTNQAVGDALHSRTLRNANAIVLSLPIAIILDGTLPWSDTDERPTLACESDNFPEAHMSRLAEAAIRWLKLPAKAVLADAESERYGFICEPLGIDLIITHVHDQDEAVSLLDRGFRYMNGPHFGIPRPLRSDISAVDPGVD
ncbi:EAL domain-containing protein [Notoacmeibacter marinus]|nr:EAL domain-containing protein [Notoacmeibacter marinus]